MKRTFLLATILYREFVVYNLIFVAAAIPWLVHYGQYSYVIIMWIKIIGFALLATFYWFFRKERLFFFHNFHLNRRQLLGLAWAMDALQTFVVLFTVHLFLP